jgi:alpha-D-xyloside xylohydrolase
MKPPEPDLYIRWAQFGLLSCHSRFHGVRGREPWYFGEKAVEVVREFGRLRYRLLPHIYSLAKEAGETGLPVMRPLLLEYPDDPVAPDVDRQFLLGPELLVAPVFNAEGRCTVYLPPGAWHDWWTGEALAGPRHLRLDVPLERMPLYVRGDSLLALAPEMQHTGEREWRPLTLEVRVTGEAKATVWTPDERVEAHAVLEGGTVRLRIDGPRWGYRVRFIEPAVKSISVSGDATEPKVEREDGVTVVAVSGGTFELAAEAG